MASFFHLNRQKRIWIMLFLNGSLFFAEIIIGYYVHSLALIADSFHMLNDMLSFAIALWAIKMAGMTHWDPKYSYGWQRAEILGALINGVFLVALCFTIALSAIQRFIQPEPITDPVMVLITGCVGLAGNLLGLLLFHDHGHHHHHHHNHDHHDHEKDPDIQHDGGHLNMKGIFLHVLGDALGNIGVIATALFIWLTPYSWKFYMDPVVSLVIAIIIFFSAVPLVRATSVILLQGVPSTVPLDNVRNDISKMDDVVSVHELHIWQLSDSKLIASMHVRLTNSKNYMQIATQMRQLLHEYGVHSVTIQPEFVDEENEKIDETTALIISSTSSDSGRDAPLTKSTLVDMPEQETSTACLLRCIKDSCVQNACCPEPYASQP